LVQVESSTHRLPVVLSADPAQRCQASAFALEDQPAELAGWNSQALSQPPARCTVFGK
jgi:hypothetical protein